MLQTELKLVNRDNEQNIKVISQTKLNKTNTVFNFEVYEFYIYRIGEFGVWVHNACVKRFSNLSDITNDRIQKLAKDYNDITVGNSVINLEKVGNRTRASDFSWLSSGGKIFRDSSDIKTAYYLMVQSLFFV